MTHPVPPFQLDSAHQPWSELNHELTSCRRTLLSQMSELEEYRRLKDLYPELSSWLNERVEQLLEEKYRLLGKTRALETVIGAHVSAIA